MKFSCIILVFFLMITVGVNASREQKGDESVNKIREITGEVREEIKDAEYLGALDEQTSMDLTISFKVNNRVELDSFIEELHNPNSPAYHQWLSPAEFGERFGISKQDYEAMASWLSGQGFQVTDRWQIGRAHV